MRFILFTFVAINCYAGGGSLYDALTASGSPWRFAALAVSMLGFAGMCLGFYAQGRADERKGRPW